MNELDKWLRGFSPTAIYQGEDDMDQMTGKIEGTWAVLELFGHQQVAGWIEKDERFGAVLTRVDVPEVGGIPAHSSFYGNGAIYAVHPVSEEVAKAVALRIAHRPVVIYGPELVERRMLDEERERNRGRLLDAPDDDDDGSDE